MERLLKHKLLIGLVAVLVLAGGGGAYAATQAGTTSRQALLNDVAKRLNVSPSKLRSALQGALVDRLNAAVRSGRLTQAQANAIKQKIAKGRLPIGPLGGGKRFWFHRPGLGRLVRRGAVGAFGPLNAAAKYLGISAGQLIKDLRGKTLAQVAQARGKSVSGLEQAIVSAQKTRLDRLVAHGVLTKTQEQRQLNFMSKRIGRLVEHARVEIPRAGKPPVPGGPPPGAPGVPPPPGAPAPPAP